MSNNQSCCPDQHGEFADWIEIYNTGRRPKDIGGMFITDDSAVPRFRFPTDDPKATTIPGRGFILLWADDGPDQGPLHLGFKLSSRGEHLRLLAADGTTLIDSVTFGPLRPDVSYARVPERGAWFFLDEPSPGQRNASPGKLHHSQAPTYSHQGGHYPHSITVSLFHPDPNTTIFVTTDGSIPTRETPHPRRTPPIKATTVLRSLAVTKGLLPSDVITQTYFIDDKPSLPAVSLAVDPEHLWGAHLGIYVKGNRNNFMRHWERPAHIEFYHADGGLEFSQDVGVKIHGGWSRNQPQKSLAIHARRRYGNEGFYYPLFPDKSISRYTSFILRNSGNDWTYTLLRDATAQALVKDRMEIDYQSYRPVILFLNGQYWGIHNMRERISVDYVVDNHALEPDDIDYLINDSEVRVGSSAHFQSLLNYLQTSDLKDATALDQIRSHMDVDEFLNYQIAQMYSANTDWPGNNMEFWRTRGASGRWRWIFFDTDYGFNLPLALNPSPPELNMVALASTPGRGWPNPPWATFLMESLLGIDEVRNSFIQRFASHLNTTFDWPRVEAVIDSMRNGIAHEIPRHADRWSPYPSPFYGGSFATIEEWDANLEVMRAFARVRAAHVWSHLQTHFSLGDRSVVSLEVAPERGGTLFLNSVPVEGPRSSGLYFNQVPLDLLAVPAPGFEFDSWSLPVSDTARATLVIEGNYELTARFKSSGQPPQAVEPVPVVINEINYHSTESLDSGDWVELHNFGPAPLEIAGWRLRDAGNSPDFVLPPHLLLPGGGYVVLCRDSTDFRAVYPRTDCTGNLPFGLSSRGDHLTLLTDLQEIIDAVAYDERPPWPTEPNGTGFTLALVDPTVDNSSHEHWYPSANGGTPGAPNASGGTYEIVRATEVTAYPNPFSTGITVALSLPARGNVSIHVFNLLGALVATLVENGIMEAGAHSFDWSGLTADGDEVASGVYLCRIRINGAYMGRKVLKVGRNR